MMPIAMKRHPNRSNQGFTIIELLVAVVIIGILAAIALPNFVGVQDKARNASVKSNMRTTQIAAESFATDNGGTYPDDLPSAANAFGSYFPGGNSSGGVAGNPPVNPFTNAAAWSNFVAISISSVADERALDPSAAQINGNPAGALGYGTIGTGLGGNAVAYGIEGADSTGKGLGGTAPGTTLVMSNQ